MRRDKVIEKLEVTVISLFFSFSVAYFVSLWAVASAYAERGYRACGGEYLLIAVAFITAYRAISQFFKYFRRESHGKERCRRTFEMQHIG